MRKTEAFRERLEWEVFEKQMLAAIGRAGDYAERAFPDEAKIEPPGVLFGDCFVVRDRSLHGRCDKCLARLVAAAFQRGATREEILEATIPSLSSLVAHRHALDARVELEPLDTLLLECNVGRAIR